MDYFVSCLNCFDSFKKTYFGLFITQIFDIGNSTGSIVMEAVTLLRTFQRFSAPSEFITKFSPEFMEMFSWATDLVEIISKSVRTIPFSSYELLLLYGCIFPLAFLSFESFTTIEYNFFILILFYGAFFLLGLGIIYLNIKKSLFGIWFLVPGTILFLFSIILAFCCYGDLIKNFCSKIKCKFNHRNSIEENDSELEQLNSNSQNDNKLEQQNLNIQNDIESEKLNISNQNDNESEQQNLKSQNDIESRQSNSNGSDSELIQSDLIKQNNDNINKTSQFFKKHCLSISYLISIFFFYSMMFPLMLPRWKLALTVSIIVYILTALIFLIELFLSKLLNLNIKKISKKLSSFLVNFIILIIIPATENIFSIIKDEDYKQNWFMIGTYLYGSFIIPIALILTMVISKHPDITDKYKPSRFNLYYYFELLDVLRQIGYAISIELDCLWACLGIEIFWLVLIISVRPFNAISEHSLSFGNSLLLIISNGTFIYFDYHPSDKFSFGISILFLILACTPALISLILFFIFDFDVCPDDNDDNEDLNSSSSKSFGVVASILTPLLWFSFGLNLLYLIEAED